MNAFDHANLMIAYAADHREALMAEAEIDRLLNLTEGRRPRFHRRVLNSVGDTLIAIGTRMKFDGYTSKSPVR